MTMAAFGLGTLPSLLTAGVAASWLQRFTRSPLTRQLVGASVILMAAATVLMPMGHKGMHGHAMHQGTHTGMEHSDHTPHSMN
jgi:sulfite exporter TauE/SafE